MLTVAYGEATLDRNNVYRWYKMFSEGREDVNDEERAGRPSTSTTDERINEVEKMILANRRITVREVAEDLNISIGSYHSNFINDLGMRRVAAKFVPKLLNCDQKQHRMNIANEMLDSVRDDPNLLQRVITDREKKSKNWADRVEVSKIESTSVGNKEPKGFKRKINFQEKPVKIPKADTTTLRPPQPSRRATRNPVTQVKNSRQQQALSKARSEAASFDQCCYIEYCSDFSPVQYIQALEEMLGTGAVFQLMKMSGQVLVGLESTEKTERLSEEGLTIGNTLLKVFPYRKRAEKIVVGNIPIAIRDEDIVAALRPYCRVVSLTHQVVASGGYTWTTGNMEALILLNEGLKLHQLPVKLVIVSKGESTPAYITYGFMCSKCHRHPAGPGVEASLLKAYSLQQLRPLYNSRGTTCAHKASPVNTLQPCRVFARGKNSSSNTSRLLSRPEPSTIAESTAATEKEVQGITASSIQASTPVAEVMCPSRAPLQELEEQLVELYLKIDGYSFLSSIFVEVPGHIVLGAILYLPEREQLLRQLSQKNKNILCEFLNIANEHRRLAWPLRKDDTQNREAFSLSAVRPRGARAPRFLEIEKKAMEISNVFSILVESQDDDKDDGDRESPTQPTKVAKAEAIAARPSPQPRREIRDAVTHIRTSRQQQDLAKARAAAATYDQYCFIEWSPDFHPVQYTKALEQMLGKSSVYQFMKMSGHVLVGLSSAKKVERLIEEGLNIGSTLLRAFPYRKRAEKIIIGNLPIAVKDVYIVAALRPYCKVASIAYELVTCEGYSWTKGIREAFIFMNEGLKIHQPPVKLEIKSRANVTAKDIGVPAAPRETWKSLPLDNLPPSMEIFLLRPNHRPRPNLLQLHQLQLATMVLKPFPDTVFENTEAAGMKKENIVQAIISKRSLRKFLPDQKPEQLDSLIKLIGTFVDRVEDKPATSTSDSPIFGQLPPKHAVDVAFVQETNVLALNNIWDLCLGYSAVFAPSSTPRGSCLAVVVAPGVTVLWHRVLWPGKITIASINIRGLETRVINCHLSHTLEERNLQLQVIGSGAVEAFAEILDRTALVDTASIFNATHLPTRVASYGSRVDAARLDRFLIPSRLSGRFTRYWTLKYRCSDHRAILRQVEGPPSPSAPPISALLRLAPVIGRGKLKRDLVEDIKFLSIPRAQDEDYIARASRSLRSRFEAETVDADYPLLPELGRALRIRLPRSEMETVFDAQGNPVEEDSLRHTFFNSYSERFDSFARSTEAIAGFLQGATEGITLEDSDQLHRADISLSEVETCISRLPQGKAAGWDSVPCDLVKVFEDFFGRAIHRVILESKLRGTLPESSRKNIICLDPKAHGGPGLSGYRPIALPTADYRITYAVPGRCPSWNIACVSDEVALAVKNKSPLAVIFTDLQSAFDNVDREFLAAQLLSISLPLPFMEWLHLLYAEADATIKQGCACCAALFSIFTGPLLSHLERALGRGNVLAYADDILLLIREDRQFEKVKTIFGEFRCADRADSPLGISWSASSITVLGCEVTSGQGRSVQENHLLGILERAISRWSPYVRGFSLVGRARAANSLVLAAVLHHLHGYLPGEATIAKLQARLTRFV
ncbi:hypothetical protein LAZ67_20001803 [Cordylochernes scorpioides]|uniref:Reverse transcriptase domain-containing protein n=1 Tax=Cordylochernes scorpioides TaxID=51811 RepID=A0ABY6LM15_9ARAC|nr:hypothetical protein LAZ67_20001803 [Cordylochernes scorpioides]